MAVNAQVKLWMLQLQSWMCEAWLGASDGKHVLLGLLWQRCTRMKLVWFCRAAFNGITHKYPSSCCDSVPCLQLGGYPNTALLLSGTRRVGKAQLRGRQPVVQISVCLGAWRDSLSQELVTVENSFIHFQLSFVSCASCFVSWSRYKPWEKKDMILIGRYVKGREK